MDPCDYVPPEIEEHHKLQDDLKCHFLNTREDALLRAKEKVRSSAQASQNALFHLSDNENDVSAERNAAHLAELTSVALEAFLKLKKEDEPFRKIFEEAKKRELELVNRIQNPDEATIAKEKEAAKAREALFAKNKKRALEKTFDRIARTVFMKRTKTKKTKKAPKVVGLTHRTIATKLAVRLSDGAFVDGKKALGSALTASTADIWKITANYRTPVGLQTNI